MNQPYKYYKPGTIGDRYHQPLRVAPGMMNHMTEQQNQGNETGKKHQHGAGILSNELNKLKSRQNSAHNAVTKTFVQNRYGEKEQEQSNPILQEIQKNAIAVVEAHEFQQQLDGMQSIPRRKLFNKPEQDNINLQLQLDTHSQQRGHSSITNAGNIFKSRTTQSAKVTTQNPLRDQIDYDELRKTTLVNRRSARNRKAIDETLQDVIQQENGNDYDISGETIYLFGDGQ